MKMMQHRGGDVVEAQSYALPRWESLRSGDDDPVLGVIGAVVAAVVLADHQVGVPKGSENTKGQVLHQEGQVRGNPPGRGAISLFG